MPTDGDGAVFSFDATAEAATASESDGESRLEELPPLSAANGLGVGVQV
jgi:hypothetical protein